MTRITLSTFFAVVMTCAGLPDLAAESPPPLNSIRERLESGEPDPQPPDYKEHMDLGYYLDEYGKRREVRTADDWRIRRRHIQGHLRRVMGQLPSDSMRVPLNMQVVEESRHGDLVRRKIRFQSDPFDRVTAWLLIPAAAEAGKRPAVLCLHQTVREGKDEPAGLAGSPNMHYGRELAQRGYVVLVPDYPSLGEHAYDFAQHPEFASGSMKAVWDNIRAVDLLAATPQVDSERIGMIGHSLGGHNALFTAVFEPRIRVVVSSCGFTSLAKDDLPSWTGPRYMPRIASEFGSDTRRMPFDFSEILASIAPRPLLVCAPTGDNDFDVTGVRDTITAAQPIYTLLGEPEHLQAHYPDGPHDFPNEARQRAYRFLDRHLSGNRAQP
jgi:dienelactone hydrolase